MMSHETITLYHGTDAQFDAFSMDFAAREEMSGNGNLGIWLAVDKELAGQFANTILTVEMPAKGAYLMPIDELSKLNRECQALSRSEEPDFYRKIRASLLDGGHTFVSIIEQDGSCHMHVALCPELLNIVDRHTKSIDSPMSAP